ncbi:hypothetical protein TBLA_0C07070 [Henningerozyma blattae CBS 6284]|uniref:1,3-beta-glucanosyltransferase n=1 Tax=Henningerozyma blattae (strain ATCC 34711 / CBS 6284 / DSM 70876 / NBRC 10599 / NRRL Y-10934 / UCD 77-7) TaxID=1071380 RepID=I2H296_HENB6|nr:hypothetical protein TBLA_0C07070 [Tetrapisispora blattae CBS 6284]CCH60498.1 hypothetical protein TBLA_0C07070 [Tetrapisispora blattae CBS 6284]
MLLKSLATLAASALFAGQAAADSLPEIEIVGNKFFYSNNGSQFYVKGIAYQANTDNVTTGSTINDPLANADACKRDIPYLQKVNTNVIRVYAINTSLDHSECMQSLNDAGIYVIADLSAPDESINRDAPTWTVDLYQRYKDVVDELANYTNVLGFFAGNEVTNNSTNTDASAFVKAAIRDTKSYIKQKGYRNIPVGYSSNDDADTRVPMADYFACGKDSIKADFYGINMYEWCGSSTFQKSGYADRTKDFQNLTIPIFFSEYGCNEVQPRKFTEVEALYGSNMTNVWSGGIVYMYFEEENNYGLVTIDNNEVSTKADYSYYSSEIAKVSPSIANTKSYSSNSSATMSCPASQKYWKAATVLPPTPDSNICGCMSAAASCVVDKDVDEEDYQTLFDYICGEISCDGISGDGSSGTYGSYSFCSAKDQLNFVLNLYYESNGKSKSACDFSGSASVQSGSTKSGCSSILKAIGTAGTGSYSATSVGNSTETKSSDSASGSSISTSTKKNKSSSGSSQKDGKDAATGSSSASSTSGSSSGSKNAAVSNMRVNIFEILFTSILTISVAAGLGFALA